jgi:alpha-ketoglutarate-dependent taurine dioxygenase
MFPAHVTHELWAPAFGSTIAAADRAHIVRTLSDDAVWELYRDRGAVLFRGFQGGLQEHVIDFASRFLSACVSNGSDERRDLLAAGQVQSVNRGDAMIPPHAEMAYGPLRPDVLFFYCVKRSDPPMSATLACDGHEVWERLPCDLRRLFSEKKLRYRFRRSMMLGEQCRDHMARIGTDPRVRLFRIHDDGSADLDFVVSAAEPSRHGGAPAFANSAIVEKQTVSFEDGTPLDETTRRALFTLTSRLSYQIVWQTGDLLMLDNSRVMHGRRGGRAGTQRQIAIRMGWECDRAAGHE